MEANFVGPTGNPLANGLGSEAPPSSHTAAAAVVVVRPWRGLAIVAPRGAIDDSGVPLFREAVVGCLEDGATALVIDLSLVSSVSAAALAVAVYAGRRLGAHRVAIVCPDPHIVQIFRACGFERLVMICESREMAVPLCLALGAGRRLPRPTEPVQLEREGASSSGRSLRTQGVRSVD